MFTGIIQEVGTVKNIQEKNGIKTFTIKATQTTPKLNIGDSVSVDGCCLTVIEKTEEEFKVEAIPETLKLTRANEYKQGTEVNLEPAMQLNDRLHGHMVSGHIDFMGTVIDKKPEGDSQIFIVTYPKNYGKYFSLKGSVTLNGVSLTISKINPDSFEVSLIPHTLAKTNLHQIHALGKINVEVDIIARYLESLLNAKEDESNYFFLQERGFI